MSYRVIVLIAASVLVASPARAQQCGDGTCNGTETRCDCPADCTGVGICGDGCCTHYVGGDIGCTAAECHTCNNNLTCTGAENFCSCPLDNCMQICGDGCCTGAENASNCNKSSGGDCLSRCGDGACTSGETDCNCPSDCPQ